MMRHAHLATSDERNRMMSDFLNRSSRCANPVLCSLAGSTDVFQICTPARSEPRRLVGDLLSIARYSHTFLSRTKRIKSVCASFFILYTSKVRGGSWRSHRKLDIEEINKIK